jgi:predicted acylesterase/phospholipase RssA
MQHAARRTVPRLGDRSFHRIAIQQQLATHAEMHHAHHDCSGILYQILSSEDYAIALTPGFYRFYALIGVLQALEERGCLRPSHVSGASAGALVGGFLASGTPYLVGLVK